MRIALPRSRVHTEEAIAGLGLFGERIDEVAINFWNSDHARCARRSLVIQIETAGPKARRFYLTTN